MPIGYTTAQAPLTTDKQHFEALSVGWLAYDTVFDKIFDVKTGNRKNYDFVMISGGAGLEESVENGNFTPTSPSEVGSKTITMRRFQRAIPVSDIALATADPKTIQMATRIGMRAKMKIDQIAASVFQNFLISTNGYGITINGTLNALCGATQTIGNTGKTQSNKITTDLGESSLTTAKNMLRRQYDHDGQLFGGEAATLLVPASLADLAHKLTGSRASYESGFSSGISNVHAGITPIVWTQLENPETGLCFDTNNDTQTELGDNWFLLANRMGVDNPFQFMFTVPPRFEIVAENATSNGAREYRVSFWGGAGAKDYLGVVGSDATS